MTTARFERDPIGSMLRLQGDLARVFAPVSAKQKEATSRTWSPSVDVHEDADAISIRADLPGVEQSDINIEMTGDTLTIAGERKQSQAQDGDGYLRRERRFGAFQRRFTIGIPVESQKIKASFKNGILEVTVPKAEATKPKKIDVISE